MPRAMTPEEFWRRTDRVVQAPCWIWLGSLTHNGYGVARLRRYTGLEIRAPRIAWVLANGRPIPAGLTIDHLCRTPACINPDHLEAVTMSENNRRGTSPSAQNARKTNCIRGHDLSDARLYRGKRFCRACDRFYPSHAPRYKGAVA